MLYVTDWRRNIQMKQYKIEITNLAEMDLECAGDYIAYELKNPTAAVNTIRGIRKQINSLTNFPKRNELDEDELLAELGVIICYTIFILLICRSVARFDIL